MSANFKATMSRKESAQHMQGPATGNNNVLDALDALVHKKKSKQVAGKKKKSKEEEEEERRFVSAVSQILALVPKDANIQSLWARLFHERMTASQTLCTTAQMEHYREIFTEWLDLVPASEENTNNRKLAISFINYAACHHLDPDNSLLGLHASEKAILLSFRATERKTQISPGDLFIYRRAKSQPLVFARVVKVDVVAQKHVATMDPFAAENETVPEADMFLFDERIREHLSSLKMMEKLVVSPAEEFFASLNADIRARSSIFLQEQGINVHVLRRFAKNEVSILDTNVLKTIRGQLTSLLENIEQTDFFKTIRLFTSERVDRFLSECDVRLLFPATRHRTLETLRTTPFSALAKVDLQKFIAVCDSALDLLTLEKKRLLSGTLKNQLSEWWLQLIKEAVEKFLKEEGYELEAVPFNYIQHAPKSIEAVKKNLNILQTLLANLSDRSTRVHTLIADMRAQIGPKIDEFIEKAQFIICEYLEMDRIAFTLDRAKTALQQQRNLEPQLVDALGNIVMDLEYLREMKHLEDNPASEGGLKLGVVPISGMVVGYFYRYENELITVLDVWGSREEKDSVAKPVKNKVLNDSPIERALAAAAKRANARGSTTLTPISLFLDASQSLGSAQVALQRLAAMEAAEREELIEEAKEERLRDAQVEESRKASELSERHQMELLREFQDLQARQLKIVQALKDRTEQLQDQFNRLQADTTRLQLASLVRDENERKNATPATTRVKLNVGGRRFATTLATMLTQTDSLLAHMFRGSELGVTREAFIDRDGTNFHHILNYLRDGDTAALPTDPDTRAAVAREARYYGLQKLLWLVEGQPEASRSGVPAYLQHIPTPPNLSPAVSPLNSVVPTHPNIAAPHPSHFPSSTLATGSPLVSPHAEKPRVSALEYIAEQRASAPGSAPATSAPSLEGTRRETIASFPSPQLAVPPSAGAAPNRGGSALGRSETQPALLSASATGARPTLSSSPPNNDAPLLAGSAMYQFLASCGLPDDACKQYEKIFADKGIKVADIFNQSQNALKDMGVKMGHVMKIMKLKPAGK